MKKLFFMLMVGVMALGMTNCVAAMGVHMQDIPYSGFSNSGLAYEEDYLAVDWANLVGNLYYCNYDEDQIVLVVYNGRIFIVPNNYFHQYIYQVNYRTIRWYPNDYFTHWFGSRYYNHIWNNWHWRHNRRNWDGNRNWYDYHKQYRSNRPIIRRDTLRNPSYNRNDRPNIRYTPQNRTYSDRNRANRSPSFGDRTRIDRRSDNRGSVVTRKKD